MPNELSLRPHRCSLTTRHEPDPPTPRLPTLVQSGRPRGAHVHPENESCATSPQGRTTCRFSGRPAWAHVPKTVTLNFTLEHRAFKAREKPGPVSASSVLVGTPRRTGQSRRTPSLLTPSNLELDLCSHMRPELFCSPGPRYHVGVPRGCSSTTPHEPDPPTTQLPMLPPQDDH